MDRKQSIITKDKAARNMVFLILYKYDRVNGTYSNPQSNDALFFDGYESRLNEKLHKFAEC